MAEIDDLIKDIDNVLGNKEEPQTEELEVKDETDELISEIESVLSFQPAEEKPKEELPKAVPSALPAPTPVKEPEIDLSKPSNIVLSVIGDKDEEEFTPADRDLIKSLDAEDLNEFIKSRPDVFLDDDQKRQIFNYQRELRKSSPYGKIPTNWEEWYNLGAAASEDLAGVGVMTADLLGGVLKGTAKAVKQGAPALLGMTSGYAKALAAEKLLPEDKKAEVESWRKRAWQIANTPIKGGEKQNPDAYTDAKYLAKIKEYLTPEQIAGIEKEFQEKRYQAKQVPFSYTSELASLPESVAFLGTKLGTGGMQLWDDASEKFGLTDEETSFERFKARSEVNTAQAKLIKSEPKSWARVVDTYYAPVMKSFSSLIHPSIDEYMIMYPDLSREEVKSKRQADIENGVLNTIEDIKKSIPENDPDIATFGSLTIPGQFGVDVFGYAYSVVQASKMLTPIAKLKLKKLGLDDDQINALETKAQEVAKKKELSKLEKLQKPGFVERAAGATARGIEKTSDYLERSPTWQTITKTAPAVTGATIGYQVNPENPLAGLGMGAFSGIGAKYGVKALIDLPKVVKEVQAARRISAGGSVGPLATLGAIAKQQDEVKTLTAKLKTLAEGTDEYVETKKALDLAKEKTKGEGIVDYEGIGKVSDTTKTILRFVNDDAIANIGEYARLGVEPTLIALATGVIDSSDEEELKTMIGQGLVFSLGGRAVQQSYHKFVGEDPVIAARRAKQANVDALKAYRDSTPETRGEIDKLTDWELVIGRQAKKVADTEAEVQRLVNESPDNKKIEEAEKRLEAEKKSLSLLKTANVQTRNEFGRQFLTALGRNNLLLNGALKAGQNNVGIHILSTDQIFNHFRQNPALRDVPDETIYEIARQQGFYSGTGQNEFRPGMEVSDAVKNIVFNQAQPSIVINSDALRNRIDIYGETPIDALNHETGHAILRIKEIQDAVSEARKLLFSNQIRDAEGNVKEVTTGLYNEDQLIDLYENTYLKNYNKKQIEAIAKASGLWDYGTNSLSRKNVSEYMQEEILADLFSNTLSRNLGRNIDPKSIHLLDVARAKLKNNLLKKATTKLLGLGYSGDVVGYASKANLPPEVQSAARNAMRLLESLNGDFATIENKPETATISKADIRKSKIAAERYGMDSGLFATKVQAQVFDADGNPVGTSVDVTDPTVFEGTWRITKDGEERLNGYGQIPVELRQLQVPEGGTLAISKKIVTEADGITPKLLKPSDLKKIAKDRATLFKQAIDTPDYGTPGRFEAVSEGSNTYRGTFTPLQIKAIQELPEGIVPLKIKKYLLELNDAIVKKDGSRFFVDYAAVMDDKGNYKAFSPKIYDVVPIGLHLSSAGNFLVTTISVGRMMSKLNAWSDRMPNRLSPWGGSKEAFWSEFSTKYLDNWSKGIQGSGYNEQGEPVGRNQLSEDVAIAEQKKSIFNDFLNLFKNETEALNLDRTKIPKRKGDEKNKSMDRTIMSMRIDHMAELLDASDLPKLPVDYGKAIINFLPGESELEIPATQFMPAETIEAPSGERGFQSKLQLEIQRKFRGATATPEQLKAVINNPQNVKAEEVKWSGVNDAIDRIAGENNGKVPVQELLNYLRDEGQVKFEEVTLGGLDRMTAPRSAERLRQVLISNGYNSAEADRVVQAASREENIYTGRNGGIIDLVKEVISDYRELEEAGTTKFAGYVLPGGENYREVVMAMPIGKGISKQKAIQLRDQSWSKIEQLPDFPTGTNPLYQVRWAEENHPELYAEWSDFSRAAENKSSEVNKDVYTSSHFSDIPNYVAHMRLNDRTDAEGNDGLFIEELQSDRHQAGREKGYLTSPKGWTAKQTGKAGSNLTWSVFDAEGNLVTDGMAGNSAESAIEYAFKRESSSVVGKVPDAPFRKDWSVQLFKRVLRDAVESGKQWIGWTTGETQAERYDLSKQIDMIQYDPKSQRLLAYKKDSSEKVLDKTVPLDGLEEYVGKEVAQKIADKSKTHDPKYGPYVTIENADLTVGGEGMKGFYDTILPKEIGKYVAKMGGKVEKSEIVIEKPSTFTQFTRTPNAVPEIINVREKTAPIWRVNITPEMANVVSAGQIQFMPAEVDTRFADLEAKAKAGDKKAEAEAIAIVENIAKNAGGIEAWHFGSFDPSYDPIPKTKKGMHFGSKEASIQRAFDKQPEDERRSLEIFEENGLWYWKTNTNESLDGFSTKQSAEKDANNAIAEMWMYQDYDYNDLGNLTKTYLFFNNLKTVKDQGDNWNDIIIKSKEEGYDGLKYKNEFEDEGSTSYVIFNPQQAKSADPFTYDDAGNLIPLSQRFQTTSPDIRFMPAEQGAEPEGLQGIELPTQYRRISDMIPPLRDVEPPIPASQAMPPESNLPEIIFNAQGGEMAILKQALQGGTPVVQPEKPKETVVQKPQEIPVAKVEPEEEVSDKELVSTGIEVPEFVDEQSVISNAIRVANSKPWKKGRDFKLDIQQRVLEAAEKAGVKVSERTLETIEYLSRVGLKDALIALEQNPNAIGWYDEKTKQALEVMSLLFPEIATDENARFAFTWALAVTSNGLKVDKNFELAEGVYRAYRKTGKMPTNIQAGQAQKAINQSLGLFNQLTNEWGIDNTRKFMQTEFTVQEISRLGVVNKASKKDVKPGGEYADTLVRGSSILGPKIGNGFFSNLYGLFDALTMDRWLIRTWGRWTGTLIELNPELTEQAATRTMEAVNKLTDDDMARFDEMLGRDISEMSVEELATAIQKASMKPELREVMNKTETGEELRKSGNGLAKYLDGQKEAPASPAERNFIREIFGLMLDDLKSDPKYAGLTMADLQAVLWYAEKRLYETAKVKDDQENLDESDAEGYEDEEAPDYANAAIGVARKKGVSEKRIQQAIEKVKNDRTTTTRSTTEGRGGDQSGEQESAGGFTDSKEKQKFKHYVAASTARRNRVGNAKALWTYARKSDGDGGELRVLKPKSKKNLGIKYISEWKPGRKLATMFRNNELPVVRFLELDSTDKPSAQKFADTLQQSKDEAKFGAAVNVYPVEDYQGMKLFMSESGKSGFAVKPDGDIVSVFSMEKGSSRSILEAAISAGGKKLDAFDTILPRLYGEHGFVEASRIPWNDEFSPEGWNKQTFQEFNEGEPDVVMMVLDPNFEGQYTPRTDIYATDYDTAVGMQNALLQQVEKSGKKKK
jgi:hypothetical protein